MFGVSNVIKGNVFLVSLCCYFVRTCIGARTFMTSTKNDQICYPSPPPSTKMNNRSVV